MRRFLIFFQMIPESLYIYKHATNDPKMIVMLESCHNIYANGADVPERVNEFLCTFEEKFAADRIFADGQPSPSIDGDYTIIVTGFLL